MIKKQVVTIASIVRREPFSFRLSITNPDSYFAVHAATATDRDTFLGVLAIAVKNHIRNGFSQRDFDLFLKGIR